MGPEDNLVSWTSSLLFALVYIFHRHANSRDASQFDDISLCILDTTSLPKGVFLRDVDLIQAYSLFDEHLADLERLRSGRFYFGEYLSQGALKIRDICQIVSAQEIINRGLYNLQEEFSIFSKWEKGWKVPWARPTLDLRETIYRKGKVNPSMTQEKLHILSDIASSFEPRWRLPVVASLTTLLPCKLDKGLFQMFRSNLFTGLFFSFLCFQCGDANSLTRRPKQLLSIRNEGCSL